MQFPTGGRVRERKLNRCDSGTDSTVWMEEDFCAVTRAIWTVCLQHLKFVSGAYFVCKGWSSMKTLFSSISENVQFVLLCLAVTAAVVLLAVVPFNLLKGVLVSVLTFFLYKRVERLFFRKKQPE